MIKKILSNLENVSLKDGKFFQDKSYKYDTLFVICRLLDKVCLDDRICLNEENKKQIMKDFCDFFSLSESQIARGVINYLLETLNLLEFGKVISKEDTNEYIIIDRDIFDFICVSIENAYIYQYLIAYKVFINDNIWDFYIEYYNEHDVPRKSEIYKNKIAKLICELSPSVGEFGTPWSGNFSKFPMMVLALANGEHAVSRNFSTKDEMATPTSLAANVDGTRTAVSHVNNFYIREFKLGYVKYILKNYLAENYIFHGNISAYEEPELKENSGVNRLIYGAPGCGKSFKVKKILSDMNTPAENIFRTTFHQEYSNSDFVGQLVPSIKEMVNNETGKISKKITYEIKPGPFTLALERAMNTNGMVYLIIEEINRGNAPSIFGDIFQLLDRSEITIGHEVKGRSQYPIKNKIIEQYLGLEKNADIYIPENLTIYATMNSCDQNVFTLDTAFKRRWKFEQITNKFTDEDRKEYLEYYVPGTDVLWKDFLTKVNNKILDPNSGNGFSEDKRLGKYFVSISCLEKSPFSNNSESRKEFAYKILEYIWNDVCKYSPEQWFDIDKYNTLESLIDDFINLQNPLSVFKEMFEE